MKHSIIYRLARDISRQPIDWSNARVARLQYEVRHDYTSQLSTFDLIGTVVKDEDDCISWMMALTEIKAAPEQNLSYDAALGQGRN